MRKRVVLTAVVAALVVSLTGFAPAAIAFWSASANASVLAQPAQLEFALIAENETVSIEGESGVAYTAVRVYDQSYAPLDAITLSTAFESAGFTADAQFALAHPHDSCETQSYEPLTSEVTLAGYPEYISSMVCFRISYSGATSDHIGQKLRLSVTAEGTISSWSAGTTGATTEFTLTDAPADEPVAPITPTVFCAVGEYLNYIGARDADTNSLYQLRMNSADGYLTGYGSITAHLLASGWALSAANFPGVSPGTVFEVFVVRAGTTEAIGSTMLVYTQNYQIGCPT